MPWLYDRRTRNLWRIGNPPSIVAQGYSGHGDFKNDPSHEDLKDAGPIPGGLWTIIALIEGQTPHGPYVLRLAPNEGTKTFGRSGFLIHGDSITAPGEASLGCIILPRAAREQIWQSGDIQLVVT
jgi:hypothetical protein